MNREVERTYEHDSTKSGISFDRRQLLIAAASAALSPRLTDILKADENLKQNREIFMNPDSAQFLTEHGILEEWQEIAKALEELSIRDTEPDTTVCVPPTPLTPEMLAKIREDYVKDGHLVSDDGSFAFRLNIDVPTVRGHVSFLRGHLDVQMLVSLSRTVNVTVDDNDTVVATNIYQERSEHVPFGIKVMDATGKEIGTADANRNNIATVDARNVDCTQPLKIVFCPHRTPVEVRKSGNAGIPPSDDEAIG